MLKANGLDEYDEFKLLILANGRCAQDCFYLEKAEEEKVLELYKDRICKRVDNVIPLPENNLLICFRNGEVKKCDMNVVVGENRLFRRVLSDPKIFNKVTVQTGGYGVRWGEQLTISNDELYACGVDLPLKADDLTTIITHQVVNSMEAADILGCSRQYVNELSAKGKLSPIKSDAKTTLYLRGDVEKKLGNNRKSNRKIL